MSDIRGCFQKILLYCTTTLHKQQREYP